jgi:prevent-host-death family protein
MTVTLSTRELRDSLADVIDQAARDEVTIVTRRGREVAAVVPIAALAALREYEESQVAALIDASLADTSPSVPMADVIAETLARTE